MAGGAAGPTAGPWLERLRAAAADREAGASEVVARAAEAGERLAEEAQATSAAELVALLTAAAREMLSGQPSMAPPLNLFSVLITAASGAPAESEARAAVSQAARAFVASMEEHHESVARMAAALVRDGTVVLTHSYSATVVTALFTARAAGRTPRVICTESRPRGEGYALARRLAAAGIDTSLVLDAAGSGAVAEADLVLFGADSLALPGVFSKLGTAGLAHAAMARNVPCYVLATTEKVWPAALGAPPRIAEHAPAEIWPDAPPGVRVINRYFDITPWSAISGTITDRGLLDAEGMIRLIQEATVHPSLIEVI